MSRIKTIKYINETSVDEMVKQVIERGSDICQVIEAAKESRTEYGLKVQEFINQLSKKLDKFEVGMTLEAKHDCMNNFRKGQRLSITRIVKEGIVVDDLVALDEAAIRANFIVVSV
ncbi:hypothetical protein ACYCSU_16920 [Paenibacillus sp. ALE1]